MSLHLANKLSVIESTLEHGKLKTSMVAQKGVSRRFIRRGLMKRGHTREEANAIMKSMGFPPIKQHVRGGK